MQNSLNPASEKRTMKAYVLVQDTAYMGDVSDIRVLAASFDRSKIEDAEATAKTQYKEQWITYEIREVEFIT